MQRFCADETNEQRLATPITCFVADVFFFFKVLSIHVYGVCVLHLGKKCLEELDLAFYAQYPPFTPAKPCLYSLIGILNARKETGMIPLFSCGSTYVGLMMYDMQKLHSLIRQSLPFEKNKHVSTEMRGLS